MSHILVAEDDTRISDLISGALESQGYTVTVTDSGPAALGLALRGDVELMILDLGLPMMDGTQVLEQLRSHDVGLPIIVLSARTELSDRLRVLEGGADDYMPKPFQIEELLVRVRLRLAHTENAAVTEPILQHGDLSLNLRTHQAMVGEKSFDLSRRELDLLETFLRHPGQVLSRAQLLSQVWGLHHEAGSNVVDAYVKSLRKKIGNDRLETIRGVGYRLR